MVLGNSRIFGYRKEDRRLVIDEEQAPMVQELFELYATDQYSMKQIETLFWEKGYRNLNGKKIAVIGYGSQGHHVQYDLQSKIQGLLCRKQGQGGGYVHQKAEIPPTGGMGHVQRRDG